MVSERFNATFSEADQLQRYTELTGWIRELSSPAIGANDNAEQYRTTLVRNFTRIGVLSRLNRDILEDSYYPLLRSEAPLPNATVEAMHEFSRSLLNAYSMENLDLPMMFLQSKRLLKDAEDKRDLPAILRALDDLVSSAFTMMHMTCRLLPCDDVCFTYRDIGLEAANRILAYLPPEKFASLPDQNSKRIVLVTARYISTLFERGDALGDPEINRDDLAVLERAIALADDPFYREQVPEYDWTYHTFRALQYITGQLAFGNLRAFDKTQCETICAYTKRLVDLWEREPQRLSTCSAQSIIDLSMARAAYYAGEIDLATYKEQLLRVSAAHDENDFSFHASMALFLAPLEYIIVLDRDRIATDEARHVDRFYERMIRYLYHMPKKGSLTFVLTFLADVLKRFVQTPDGMDFETFCLRLMVALHPQTYVHTLNVADLTACLTTHLVKNRPELFFEFTGCNKRDDVRARAKEICAFAYHAALMHDIGKLFIIENILTYGRDLFSQEFDLIQIHPSFGAYMLERFPETEIYANIARGHHRYFDGSGGYPADFTLRDCKDAVIVAIATCADCMDAATDTVGRSYKDGKTFERFLEELEAESGTRYAPYLYEILQLPEARADIERTLTEGRERNYRRAYHLLEAL